jgi:hypothetical protein
MLLISSRTTLSSKICASTGFSKATCTVSVKLFVTVLKSFTVVNLVVSFVVVFVFVVTLVDVDIETDFALVDFELVDSLPLTNVSSHFGNTNSPTFQILKPPLAAVVETDFAIEELALVFTLLVFTLKEVVEVVEVVGVVIVVIASCFAKKLRTVNGNRTKRVKYGNRSIANPIARG